jgi:hypothetical protein
MPWCSLQVRPQSCSAGQYQCRSRRQEDQRPRCHDSKEVAAVISLMDGTAQVVAKLLYGSGLRIIVIIGDMIDKLARMGGAMRLNINHALDRHGSADVIRSLYD